MSESSHPESRPDSSGKPAPHFPPPPPMAAPQPYSAPTNRAVGAGFPTPNFTPTFPGQKSRKHIVWGIGGFLLGLLAAGLVALLVGAISASVPTSEDKAQETLVDAVRKCELSDSEVATVAADGKSVTFEGVGKYGDDGFDDLGCFTEALNMPSSVDDEMSQTRALDGRQESEWDSFKVTWSYHPDDGLNAVFSIHANQS